MQVIQQEEYEYTDPVTEFLSNLFVKYDFDGAQQSLQQCEKLLETDFFLAACKVRERNVFGDAFCWMMMTSDGGSVSHGFT